VPYRPEHEASAVTELLAASFRDALTGQVKAHLDQVPPSGLGLTIDGGSGNDTFNLIGVIQMISAGWFRPTPGTAQIMMLSEGHPVAVTAVVPAVPGAR
jgi:hypothetical protein